MILECKDITKIYGKGENEVIALNKASLKIDEGEFVAIIGPSGNGKSTLMHIIGAVDNPTSGEVFVEGININELSEEKKAIFRRRQVGIVYQFYNLLPILTVKENITLPVDLDNKEVDKEYFDEIINAVGMKHRLDHLPNQLSGGEQQRCAIARALINRPSILLADEPTGNLDSKTSKEIIELLKLLNKKYKQTIVMITHDHNLALLADRIITIDNGRVVKDEAVK